MLTEETRNKMTPQETLAAIRDANAAARRLGVSLVAGQRNENPHTEVEAPNPAHGVTRIRLLGRPAPPMFFGFDVDAVKDHNTFVSSLGASGTRFEG